MNKTKRKKLLSEIEELLNKYKEPCSCPKGGMYEYENGETEICHKCGGSEWVLPNELSNLIYLIAKELNLIQ